jgi:hypothetical protein
MLLKNLMKPELLESPELWVALSDSDYIVDDYENQLRENVEFAVSWFDWSSKKCLKECIEVLGWKYITHRQVGHEGFVTLEAFFEPEEYLPFNLKCSGVFSVSTICGEVIESLSGPVMLHFPNGEQRKVSDVSSECQHGNYDLLKECIDLGNLAVCANHGTRPTRDCIALVSKYRYRPCVDC